MAHLRYSRDQQHGFAEFILEAPLENLLADLRITGSVGDAKHFKLGPSITSSKSLFFNTYFLDDGDYTFELNIANSDELIIDSLAGNLCICNGISSLACELRQAFLSVPQCALTMGPLDSVYFDLLPKKLRSENFPLQTRAEAQHKRRALSEDQLIYFDQTGTLVLEGFFDKPTVDAAKKVLHQVNIQELYGFKKGSSQRIVNLHETYDELEALYSSRILYDVVSDLFGVQAFPCQSLTFINGSTQDPHQDTIHLTPFPRGLMCGIWIAIEDVVPGAGELVFYPGSHTLPAVLCSSHNVPKVDSEHGDYSEFGEVFTPLITDLLTSNPQLEGRQFIAKAGDVLVWQENLIHGGAQRIIQDQTRMSMVIHAFGEPALIYYDSLGMSGKRDISLN